MKKLAACGALAMTCFASQAATDVVQQLGTPDCAAWFSQSAYAHGWLNGWLSSANGFMTAKSSADYLADVSPQQTWMWMDNYCKAHPLQKVSDGAFDLFDELVRKKKR